MRQFTTKSSTLAPQHINPLFKFYFKDGNRQMYEAENMYDALSYVLFVAKRYNASDIWKIEEVEE